MKSTFLFILSMMTAISYASARQGENDRTGGNDDGAIIFCSEIPSQTEVLKFHSTQENGRFENASYSIAVKTKGDNISEISLLDKRSGDAMKVKTLEELVKVVLTVDEDPNNPIVSQTTTHRGAGEVSVTHPSSNDKASARSLNRRGVNMVEIVLSADENPGSPLIFICQKTR